MNPIQTTETRPICPHCSSRSTLIDSIDVYGTSYGLMWVCSQYPACDAYVGVHKGTHRPKGTLANAEMREWRKLAHAAFDALWKANQQGSLSKQGRQLSDGWSRSRAYKWLAESLDLHPAECHIGEMDDVRCREVLRVCAPNLNGNVQASLIMGVSRLTGESCRGL